ncbi:hypothetical protein M422DRAFT_30592 [Sphaerobolus stellatus SS14]|uniref:Nucleoporin Nup133/Nup155-like C-terminal domain-containing protein n=1 Tax=Sphaerobolus stellatus (strain SS14) TaxID=990650 RepID=A0A0C9VPI8_SPHS4|nr:hypothetical protein M422DRAFT_30592 [Sphaerobolus stellatus SS14]
MFSSPSPVRNATQGTPRNGAQDFLGNRGRSPRFGTSGMRRVSLDHRGESPSKYMDVDSSRLGIDRGRYSEESRVFAVSDTLSIRLAASLPAELHQEFQSSDPTRDDFSGSICVFPGPVTYGLVVSVQTCFVWRVDLQSAFTSPTCYMFPVPPPDPSNSYLTLPFASLVSFGASREPGLILVSSSGEVRFWDSIGIGLAGAERFSTAKIDILENEVVQGLEQIDSMVYVARTKTRLHRLTVTARPGTGKFVIVATPFSDRYSQNSTWLSFRLFRRQSTWDSGDIVTVATPSDKPKSKHAGVLRSEQKPVWVLTNRNIMQWNVGMAGGEECIHNYEIRDVIGEAILQGKQGNMSSLDLELLDVALDSVGDPVILVSHLPVFEENPSVFDMNTGPLRIYALVRLSLSTNTDRPQVKTGIEILPYELASDPRRALAPRFTVLREESEGAPELTFSQFSDAFAFSALEPPYQEQLHLKDPDDMVLAFGVIERVDGPEVLLLTTGMVLAAHPNIDNIRKMKDDVNIGKANVLKSTIRQAMKYGIKLENPLRFQLPSMADEDSLKTAAEHMSYAFLTSDPDVVPPSLSLGSQLASRESSLKALVTFIGESGTLSKLSPTAREQLLANAEKLAAARGVWAYHNEEAQKHSSLNVLYSAVESYMRHSNRQTDGDILRDFFNSEVSNIASIIPEIVASAQSAVKTSDQPQDAQLLIQSSGLVEAIFVSAFNYRTQNRAKYQLANPVIQPWTSDSLLLSNLRHLFEMVANLDPHIASIARGGGSTYGNKGVHEPIALHLEELAGCLFKAYSDRLEYLNSHAEEGTAMERERNRVDEEYRVLRPVILDHLVRAGRTEYAFTLAETYKDFHALSGLSYHPSAERLMSAKDRIQGYINRFRGDFASQLFQWYIEQGKLRLLFDEEDTYSEYIDKFFGDHPTPRISWIHDLKKKEKTAYLNAAEALLHEAANESNREARHFMLSLGKLAAMAQGPAETPKGKVRDFDTSLDFMAIHDTLLEQLNDGADAPASFALESRVRAIMSAKCAVPSDRPALQNLFQRTLRSLLQGNALSEEDAVDLLSLKDNSESALDFVDALNIISNSHYIKEDRKPQAFRNVWRRIYLHDDWTEIRKIANRTDYELIPKLRNTKVYQVLASSGLNRNAIVLPSEAIDVPTVEDIAKRWPGMTPGQVQELVDDYNTESQVLSSNGPRDIDFADVRRLVEKDLAITL